MEKIPNWINAATIGSFVVGGLALIFQIFEWATITPATIKKQPWFHKMMRLTPLVITAGLFFIFGTIYQSWNGNRGIKLPEGIPSAKNTATSQPTAIGGLSTLDTGEVTPTPTVATDLTHPFFSDDFEGKFKNGWKEVSGDWIINNGKPFLRGDKYGLVVVGNPDWDNLAFDVDLLNLSSQDIIFAYRNVDGQPVFSSINFDHTSVFTLKIVDDKGSSYFTDYWILTTYIPDAQPPFKVHTEIRGNSIQVRVNNIVAFELNELKLSLAGPVGLYTSSVGEFLPFDNFAVYDLSSQ